MRPSFRLASWIDRHRWAILATALVVAVGAGAIASRLPVHGDFSYLLPGSAPSVRQLRQLEGRVANLGSLLVAVESADPRARAQAAQEMRERLEGLDPGLVSTVIFDDQAARRFVWENRFLYADRQDLEAARETLAGTIARAKLEANPLYIDFEDDAAAQGADAGGALQAKLDDAEAQKSVVGRVSPDGRLQLIIVRTTFEAGTASKGRELVRLAEDAAHAVRHAYPQVEVALTGDVIIGLTEQRALLSGMVTAVVLTVIIVAIGLLLFYRAVRAIGVLLFALGVGVAVTFAFTRLVIGHLNMASAFLSSIVVGNGINFGILLLARHFEERRRGLTGVEAIAAAMAGTFRGTLAAALTAAVAYGSLAATTFRGFKHFGIIGGVGMIVCWIAAFTVLPAGLAVLERRGLRVRTQPRLGVLLARILPRSHGAVAAVTAVGLLATVGAGVATYAYLQNPYEEDFRNLRSENGEIEHAKAWSSRIEEAFGRHLTGGYVIAAPTREAARAIVARLGQVSDESGQPRPLVSGVRSIDDMLPREQAAKLVILDELRALIDGEAKHLSPEERERLARLRPPDGLAPLAEADLPPEMARPFTERDGRRGLIVFGDRSRDYNTWVAHDLLEFTSRMSALDLPDGTAIAGANFVFADVVRSLEADGPRATVIALIGAVVVIMTLIGLGRHGAITLVCMSSGTLLMLAGAWLMGLRVNFLDFVALPITIGIGIDYAVNIVARARQSGETAEGRVGAARAALATTGGAVALCSFTTIVGYGSLLLSANLGIRSFGTAAILGEVTCILAALVLAPTLLQLVAPRRPTPQVPVLVAEDVRERASG
jgi:uncharacterized protein